MPLYHHETVIGIKHFLLFAFKKSICDKSHIFTSLLDELRNQGHVQVDLLEKIKHFIFFKSNDFLAFESVFSCFYVQIMRIELFNGKMKVVFQVLNDRVLPLDLDFQIKVIRKEQKLIKFILQIVLAIN